MTPTDRNELAAKAQFLAQQRDTVVGINYVHMRSWSILNDDACDTDIARIIIPKFLRVLNIHDELGWHVASDYAQLMALSKQRPGWFTDGERDMITNFLIVNTAIRG